jgi:DNA-binding MarR family transcriptional regulator
LFVTWIASTTPEDRRSKRVRVTRRGRAAGQVMGAAVGEVEQEFVDAHGKEDHETLLNDLNEVLGTRPAS